MSLWDEVKKLPIVDVANAAGVEIVGDHGVYAMALCFSHGDHTGEGGKPNLSLIKTTNHFLCHKCGIKGSVIDLWAHKFHLDPKQAVKELANKFHVIDPYEAAGAPQLPSKASDPAKTAQKAQSADKGSQKPAKSPLKGKPFTWTAEQVMACHEALMKSQDHLDKLIKDRGLTEEYVVQKKIGIKQFGLKMGLCYAIPIFHQDEALIGVRTHNVVNTKSKMAMPGAKLATLYDAVNVDVDAEELWICEGEGDLWTLQCRLGKNAVTTMAGANSLPAVIAHHAEFLKLSDKKRIVLMPDNDDEGETAMANVRQLLPKNVKVEKFNWPPSAHNKADISDWILKLGKTEQEIEARIQPYTWKDAQDHLLKRAEIIQQVKDTGNPIVEKVSCYFKVKIKKGMDGVENIEYDRLSTFIIRGKVMIEVDRLGYIRADIVTFEGKKEEDVVLHPDMWQSRMNFRKALPHPKYKFVGSDNDVQHVMELVMKSVKKTKKGVKYIGFVENTFVAPKYTITEKGVSQDASVEYIPQGVPLDTHMPIPEAGEDPKKAIEGFAKHILYVNKPAVVLPTIGWMAGCFFKEQIQKVINYFPILVFFGTSGAGKTSFIQSLIRMFGVGRGMKLFNAHATQFTAMRMLSCTNTVPIAIDELKQDQGRDVIDFWKRHLRSAYFGETETRGTKDLSVNEYEYIAPLLLIGEMSIVREQAIAERTISIRPERFFISAAENENVRTAFYKLDREVRLDLIFPELVKWRLNVGGPGFYDLWGQSWEELKKMELPRLPDRVWKNFVVVLCGLNALEKFCESMGVKFAVPKEIRRTALLQLVEDILAVGQRPKIGFDEFLESLSTMAKGETIKDNQDYKVEMNWLWIHLNSCVPKFRKWSRDTQFDGEVLGRKEYLNQAKELYKMKEYVKDYSRSKRMGDHVPRCVLVDLRRAERMGLDVAGFGYTSIETQEDGLPEDDERPAQASDGWEGGEGDGDSLVF